MDHFYYVPLLENLKLLLSNLEILAEVANPHFCNTGDIQDFCDGARFNSLGPKFKTHPLFSWKPISLQIVA